MLEDEINKKNIENKYEVIIVDEAQDFDENEAFFIRTLSNTSNGEFYIFYDDEQNLYNNNIDKTLANFMMESPAYILTENLRNTRNIYEWAINNTNLGKTTFSNQIDGPDPQLITFGTLNQVKKYIEKTIDNLTQKDEVPMEYINIVVDDELYDEFTRCEWNFEIIEKLTQKGEKSIGTFSTSGFKGLESNIIIYVHKENSNLNYKYVGLTRARFYLYDIQLKNSEM